MKVESKLGREGFWCSTEAILLAALFEGNEELFSNGTTEDLPGHC